jgi:hypothetical protein
MAGSLQVEIRFYHQSNLVFHLRKVVCQNKTRFWMLSMASYLSGDTSLTRIQSLASPTLRSDP